MPRTATAHVPRTATVHVPRTATAHVPRTATVHVPRTATVHVPRTATAHVPRTATVVKTVCLNQFLFEGWTTKLTALTQAEIRMIVKVLFSSRVNYEFGGQMSNIHGLDRAHDTS